VGEHRLDGPFVVSEPQMIGVSLSASAMTASLGLGTGFESNR
jgi:hypothetical protein